MSKPRRPLKREKGTEGERKSHIRGVSFKRTDHQSTSSTAATKGEKQLSRPGCPQEKGGGGDLSKKKEKRRKRSIQSNPWGVSIQPYARGKKKGGTVSAKKTGGRAEESWGHTPYMKTCFFPLSFVQERLRHRIRGGGGEGLWRRGGKKEEKVKEERTVNVGFPMSEKGDCTSGSKGKKGKNREKQGGRGGEEDEGGQTSSASYDETQLLDIAQ